MRLTVRLFGRELLAVQVDADSDAQEPEPEHGPPFGFSASAGGQAELAGGWVPAEEGHR